MNSRITGSYILFCLGLTLSVFTEASAQHDPYEVFFNGSAETSEFQPEITSSEELFLDVLAAEGSLFGELTRFSSLPVRYSHRGSGSQLHTLSLFGADLSGNLNSSADYNLWSALARSNLTAGYESAPFASGIASAGTSYEFNPIAVPDRTAVGMFVTDRKGRMGLKASASGRATDKIIYMADIYRRWGRDGTVKGVFTDRIAYTAAVSMLVAPGHRITVFSTGDRSEDGLRQYATREVMYLAGNNHYNPSWGYQGGKVRNSRVARGFIPVSIIAYEGAAGRKVNINASVTYRGGTSSVSGLSWLDAATPYPDYYRYLPSYASSLTGSGIITDKWAAGDPSFTQIDWAGFYEVNSMNTSTSVYTLSDRVEKVRDIQGYARADYSMDDNTTIGASVRVRSDNVRRYRRMRDLLGGMAVEDIDQYLYDDEIYGDRTLNDARNPYRKVNEGDVFGYNYFIRALSCDLSLTAVHERKGLKLSASVNYKRTSFRREGMFEKEIYPGDLSLGGSRRTDYETYGVEATARYAFSPIHSIAAHARISRLPQAWGVHFITPMYSNAGTGVSKPFNLSDFSAAYNLRGRVVRMEAAVYMTRSAGRAELYNYWDDIASVYSAMLLEGVSEGNLGAEVAFEYDFHPRWSASAVVSAANYKYTADPKVSIYSETSLEKYVAGSVSYMKGYHTGVSPENIATGKLSYNGRGISANLALNYASGRYVAPSPLRRMQRAYNLASSTEALDGFFAQEKLGDSFTVDISFLKSFKISDGYLSLFLSVNNLLNNKDIVYGAYEQMRIARRGSGVNTNWVPFANKYLYAYGRTYYLSVSWRF